MIECRDDHVTMSGMLWSALRWCCGRCCLTAATADDETNTLNPTSPTEQVMGGSSLLQPAPDIKSPPERRSSIPLHRKRLEKPPGSELKRVPAIHLTSSDIEEESDNDDDDDDDDVGGGDGTKKVIIQLQSAVANSTLIQCQSATSSAEHEDFTIINRFYDFVSRFVTHTTRRLSSCACC